MVTSRRLLSWLVLTAIGLTLAAPGTVRADGSQDIVKLIPEDAWGFLMVRSLNTVDEKAKVLQDTLGPMIPAPITPMALGMLNLGDTLDMTKPLCIVVLDVQKLGGMDSASVLLVPAKDPQALIKKLSAGAQGDDEGKPGAKKDEPKKEGGKDKPADKGEGKGKDKDDEDSGKDQLPEGITKVAVAGKPGYAAVKDKIVVIGASSDCVTKMLKAKKTMGDSFDKARLAALDKSDIFVNVAVGTVFSAYKEMVTPLLSMAMSASDPSGKSAENLMKMIGELSTIDFGLALDKNGLSVVFLTTAKKDSDLEKVYKETKNSTDGYLRYLPKEKYIFAAGGSAVYSENAEKLSGGLGLGSMLQNAGVQGLDKDALKAIEDGLKSIAKSMTGWALSASALSEGGEGMIGLAIIVEVKDSKDCVENIRKLYGKVWEASDNEDLAKLKEAISHKPDAETIGSSKVDTITFDMKGLAKEHDLNDDEVGQVEKVLGKGITLRFGPAGEKFVVVAFGGGKQRYQAILDSVKAASGGLTADSGIKGMAAKLPSPRASEGFIAADNLLQLIKSVATAMGEEKEFPFEVPAIDAPVAFSSSQAGAAQQVDIIVPMKLVTSIKELVEKQMAAQSEAFEEEEEEGEDKDEESGDENEEMDKGKDKDKDEEEGDDE